MQNRVDVKTRCADTARVVFKALLGSSESFYLTELESASKTIAPMQLAKHISHCLTAGEVMKRYVRLQPKLR